MSGRLNGWLSTLGYQLVKVGRSSISASPYSSIALDSGREIIDLEALARVSRSIPGMISPTSGQHLYTLCYMQPLRGDVVEIGSWKGRSTSFLARAVAASRNGTFYAIDHFKGNVGKERYYFVKNEDPKVAFLANVEAVGLTDTVHLLDMPNDEAVAKLEDVTIRFLFIDGDHTKEGVTTDIALFFPKLTDGSIVVFDDFSEAFPGVIEAVDELLEQREFSRVMTYQNTLVLML